MGVTEISYWVTSSFCLMSFLELSQKNKIFPSIQSVVHFSLFDIIKDVGLSTHAIHFVMLSQLSPS